MDSSVALETIEIDAMKVARDCTGCVTASTLFPRAGFDTNVAECQSPQLHSANCGISSREPHFYMVDEYQTKGTKLTCAEARGTRERGRFQRISRTNHSKKYAVTLSAPLYRSAYLPTLVSAVFMCDSDRRFVPHTPHTLVTTLMEMWPVFKSVITKRVTATSRADGIHCSRRKYLCSTVWSSVTRLARAAQQAYSITWSNYQ
ncbi:hypothetical protein J6590_046286 [Homalodisca vitripennis]|nr:hypothetical protein J6590_046286 [Homalodisca vitripennis]